MRDAFVTTLVDVAKADPRVWLVCGDLGYNVLHRFSDLFPERFLNAGVAEQNMTGVAAGLAHSGKVVFVYSIVNFPVMRCLEQVRNDVCYHNLNVKVVAVGGGLVYGGHGYTHHGSEDLAAMRSLPNMTVVAPGDPVETRLATTALAAMPGPGYLRLGRGGEATVHATPPALQIGKAIRLRTGSDVTLASTGGTLGLTVSAAEALASRGISTTVLSVPTLYPFDTSAIVDAARATGRLITVEEHGWGGLGTMTAEALATAGLGIKLKMLRLRREPVEVAGQHEYLRGLHGISLEGIVAAATELMA